MGSERQARWKKDHRERGLCTCCSRPTWKTGLCFRHHLSRAVSKAGLRKIKFSDPAAWNAFAVGMEARYHRIVTDEGFAVKALNEVEEVIDGAKFPWARGRARTKLMEIVAAYDDAAIREVFQREGK